MEESQSSTRSRPAKEEEEEGNADNVDVQTERDTLLSSEERRAAQSEDEHVEEGDITSPMRSVQDVLREAEGIFSERGENGEWQRAVRDEKEQVLVDEVGVEYSPQKRRQHPIEIVVRHNKVISTNRDDSDSDDDLLATRRRAEGTLAEETNIDGADVPFTARGKRVRKSSSTFKKGHRRAWSMPNAKGGHTDLHVQHDDTEMEDGRHRRRVVKYRLHPRTPVGGVAHEHVKFEEIEGLDDDNELEVEINEEEIVYPPEEGGKGRRTVIKRFWEARWKAQNFDYLPEWLQDNEYLRTGHRPPLPSFSSCFKSIFAVHTETGNIWTHMYGCVIFIGVAIFFLTRPAVFVEWEEKIVFAAFFLGGVCCLGLSFTFHTVACHSPKIGSLFSKLDYTGISMLIMGSFVPWIHYAFYCRPVCQLVYIGMICVLGTAAIIVALWDKFAEPLFRPVRAGVFVAMGLSSIFPAFHLLVIDGVQFMFYEAVAGWLIFMGALYLIGATLYATRIPERFFPGKCDIWFQSHQLFHTFVVIAAVVHFHGICSLTVNTLQKGSCAEEFHRYGGEDVETNPSWLGTYLGWDEKAGVEKWNPSMVYDPSRGKY